VGDNLDFSKLKLEAYDLLGVILPGLFAICEGWILLRGWPDFVLSLNQLSGTGFTVLLISAFGAGNLVQELGDFAIKAWKGERYFKQARDKFWKSDEAAPVKAAIKTELGHDVASVDTAFDYCLTKLQDRFAKRDVFLATSDLCRSLVVLSVLAMVPTVRITLHDIRPTIRCVVVFGNAVVLLIFVAWLSWKRMLRFRDLSETTVFRAYLATVGVSSVPSAGGSKTE
jgi:hypothetical protein